MNHSVTAGGSVGVRWYELRNPNGTPVVFQQGTYAPDAAFRWMGSIGMDRGGDIAVGYSASSSSIFPSIRLTGRTPGDAPGTLQPEAIIQAGAGSQNGGLNRWGDYSAITIDPVDDCTFWCTNQYQKTTGSFNWSTRIATFKFPTCGAAPDFSVSASPASQTVAQGAGTSYTATVTPSGGFTGTVTFSASGLPAGASASFNPASVAGSGGSTMSVATSAATPPGTYTLSVTGVSGALSHTATVTLVLAAPVAADFSLSVSPSSQTVVRGAGTTYTVNIARTGGFAGAVSLSVSGLPAGATGAFTPNPAAGNSSSLSITTSSTTATGSFALTITGVSGALTHTTSATLVVTAPAAGDFSLTVTPTSRTVAASASTSYAVNIARSGGFTGSVALSVSGLPSGATGSFSPNPTTGASSSLSVATASSTPLGTYALGNCQ